MVSGLLAGGEEWPLTCLQRAKKNGLSHAFNARRRMSSHMPSTCGEEWPLTCPQRTVKNGLPSCPQRTAKKGLSHAFNARRRMASHMPSMCGEEWPLTCLQCAEKNGLSHAFNATKTMAGDHWYYSFLKNHPDVISPTRGQINCLRLRFQREGRERLLSSVRRCHRQI